MITLYVAADGLSTKESETLEILCDLCNTGLHFGIKVNLDYVLDRGYTRAFTVLKSFGRPLFIDLKMMNGRRTMKAVARAMVNHEIDFFNVMALADSEIHEVIATTHGTKTKVLAVTVLTHFDELYCHKHFRRSPAEIVKHLAETALNVGCDGIILPGPYIDAVADLKTIKVVPGVRPKGYKDSRHQKEIEPMIAKKKGADILVCGSPIMKANDPATALMEFFSELE